MALTITPSAVPPSVIPAGTASALGPAPSFGVSATLAANEVLAARAARGEPALHLAFGEARLDVHPLLAAALAGAAQHNAYGPVAGIAALRSAAAGYWTRRDLPTTAADVVAGPGSKALLFGLVKAIGGDIALTQPSWVSYAAQTALAGLRARLVPGEAGVPDATRLARMVSAARAIGRPVRAVILTLPDNPTGRLASADAIRAVCAVAEQHDLVIISDEIYRDLVFPDVRFTSPTAYSPQRTVVTTGLSKSLALGGWRLGVARLPAGPLGAELRTRLLAIASEIWSAPAAPVQEAAAVAFTEPPELVSFVAQSRRLHAAVARAVAARFAAAGATVPAPQAAFYVYPDFGSLADVLLHRHGITSDTGLASVLLDRYGVGVLPASAFGEESWRLRVRVATSMLYGSSPAERSAALEADDPCALPWIAASLGRLTEVLGYLTG